MDLGGVETLLTNLWRKRDPQRLAFDFLVHTPQKMHYEAELLAGGAVIHRLPALRALGPVRYVRALECFFAAHPAYTIVHSHLETTTGLILQAAKRSAVPVRIAHSHNTGYPRGGLRALPENALKDWCKTKIVPNATHRLACSHEAAQWLFCGAPAQILPNGIDCEAFRFLAQARAQKRALLGVAEDERVFVHVGRYTPVKNQTFLLDFWPQVPNARLLLIGDGPLRGELEQKIAAQDARRGARGQNTTKRSAAVRVLGKQTDIAAWLCAADGFLLPSLIEGLPVALVEARASGLPCLVSPRVPLEGVPAQVLPLKKQAWIDAIAALRPCAPEARAAAADQVAAMGYDVARSLALLEEIYESKQ
jgi:glycosyltransferase involved in cell wall biosynthesis